jgi:osmotically-inducible protein OsmY
MIDARGLLVMTNPDAPIPALRGGSGGSDQIATKPCATSGNIKVRIEDALKRSAETDARRLAVDVDGGKVILRGSVRSWADGKEAERAPWAAPRGSHVENLIAIKP